MQGPFAAFAEDPRQGIIRQPGDEVVAFRLVAVPPAALDALGAAEQGEFALGEAARFLEQPQRSRARLAEFARIPFAGLDPPPGMLGPVVGLRRQAADRFRAEAHAQALDQARPVLLVGRRIAEQSPALRPEWFETRCMQLDRLDGALEAFVSEFFLQKARE